MLFFRGALFFFKFISSSLCIRVSSVKHVPMLTPCFPSIPKNCNSQLVSFAHKAFLHHSVNVSVQFFSPAFCDAYEAVFGAHSRFRVHTLNGGYRSLNEGRQLQQQRYSCGMTINRLQLTSEVKSATIFISLLYFRSECLPRLGSAAFRRQKTISSNYANVQAAVMATISSNLVNNRSLQRSFSLNTLSTTIQPCHVSTTIRWCPMLALHFKLCDGCNEI